MLFSDNNKEKVNLDWPEDRAHKSNLHSMIFDFRFHVCRH